MKISVAARGSPLSKVQCEEILKEIREFQPNIEFSLSYIDTVGDKDRQTSLRALEKTNFFTKEIDEHLLSGKSRIAIHSAKDLPDPLATGLIMIALTKGVDS